jgi:sugar O-acyltransferase (sialic acid O-acetyltransferase NeuD family)
MKKIAIYGAGGFGKEVACVLKSINEVTPTWNLIGFFDDGLPVGQKNKYGDILGGITELNKWHENLSIVFSIANASIIRKIVSKLENPLIEFPNIFAPGVIFFDKESLNIGKGNLFFFASRISCDVTIGDFNLGNSGVSLGHDVNIGSYNILGPMVRLSGNTTVGNGNFFGVQSVILQGIKIGDSTTIGAGSLVMRNTKDGYLYFGNPAKKITVK